MALQKNPTAPVTVAPGAFEDAAGPVGTVAANDEPQATESAAPWGSGSVSLPSKQTAVAERPVSIMNLVTVWDTLKEAFPIDTVASIGFSTFPAITINGGGSFAMDKEVIGNRIRVEVESWNWNWKVVTNNKDEKNVAANKLIRNSYDGVNLSDGSGTIEEYLKYLKFSENYKDAGVKQYADIFANLVTYYEEDRKSNQRVQVDVAIEDQKLVKIQLSPQSREQWTGFMVTSKNRTRKGVPDSSTIALSGRPKTIGTNTFGLIEFSQKW